MHPRLVAARFQSAATTQQLHDNCEESFANHFARFSVPSLERKLNDSLLSSFSNWTLK